MANPRARISTVQSLPPAPVSRNGAAARTIGKPHGRKRSIGVYLPANARAALEALAAATGATFGDAAIAALNKLPPPPNERNRHRRGPCPHANALVLGTAWNALPSSTYSSSQNKPSPSAISPTCTTPASPTS